MLQTETELLASNERCSELEGELNQVQVKLQEIQIQKDAISKDLNLQVILLLNLQLALLHVYVNRFCVKNILHVL